MDLKLHALVIDNDPRLRDLVRPVLEDAGWIVQCAGSTNDALAMLAMEEWSVVFCDARLAGRDGFVALRRFKEDLPDTRMVLLRNQETASGALDATSFGAYDYLLTPVSAEELQSLSVTLREQLVHKPSRAATGRYRTLDRVGIDLVGRSHAFIEVVKQVSRVASTDLPVLLIGESGTGKELIASTLHRRSGRAGQSFVAVNCGAISPEQIEAEVFGQVGGSFNGTHRGRRSVWEEAEGGTVFLDDITETSPSFQEKLLRVLQEGEVLRVGSNQPQKVNVRIVTSSNRDIENSLKAGRFREDLFYRLNAASILLPPLRDRREDIPPLAQTFADRAYSLNPRVRFSEEALELMQKYRWPGNIRELESVVVRAVAMSDGLIRIEHLPSNIRLLQRESYRIGSLAAEPEPNEEWFSLSVMEGQHVARVLDHTGGNKQAAARILGVDRKTLDRMIKRHQISVLRRGRPNRNMTGSRIDNSLAQ
ncbi:MAG: two-component system, NtrC family, response regulator AtoC [Blastocatellia bacterium]|nr:two-component system, NtrC family, response regulator AtoC [Blastocatellia bacterium]